MLRVGNETLALNRVIGYMRGAAIVQATLALTAAAVGQFGRAREFILATITYFERARDTDAVGLYTDTLGLITERAGDPDAAEAFFRQAIAILDAIESQFFAAFARLDLSQLLIRRQRAVVTLPDLETAIAVFKANHATAELLRSQALYGLALHQTGNSASARAIADHIQDTVQAEPPQGEDVQYLFWAIWQLQSALGHESEAQAMLRQAYAALQHQAALLDDQELRRAFFTAVPINRELVAAYDALIDRQAILHVQLARRDESVGRSRIDTQYVAVVWTIHSPEDDLIADKGERRRGVLQRLLDEAAAQGAAPTDDDLAAALGVSRRTILRNMTILQEQGYTPATRKRH